MRLRNFLRPAPVVTTTVNRDANIPVENAQNVVRRDANIPVENAQTTITRDANIPVQNAATLVRDGNVPVENAGTNSFALAMSWNVYTKLHQPLSMVWMVQGVLFSGPLTMTWSVFEQLPVFNMVWNVIPPLPNLFAGTGAWSGINPDVQRPVASVVKTP